MPDERDERKIRLDPREWRDAMKPKDGESGRAHPRAPGDEPARKPKGKK